MSQREDQADTLRRLMQQRDRDSVHPEGPTARVFTVSSGKGGVGKSCLVANLGALLARQGLRVLLVDGDSGLANLDILLGLPHDHRATLEQVIDGKARIRDAIVGVEPNLWLIPSASGLHDIRQSGPETRMRLMRVFEECPWEMDVILVDVGAGIGSGVLSLMSPAFESLVVVTPEPTSIADAYSLIKMARIQAGVSRFSLVVNQVTDERQGLAVHQKLKDVAKRFISNGVYGELELEYLGHWMKNEKITQSVMKRKILLDLDEGAASRACLELLAKRVSAKCQAVQGRRSGLCSDPFEVPAHEASGLASMPGVSGMHKGSGNTAGFWRTLLGEVKT